MSTLYLVILSYVLYMCSYTAYVFSYSEEVEAMGNVSNLLCNAPQYTQSRFLS